MKWKEKFREWFVPKTTFQRIILIGILLFSGYKVGESWIKDAEIERYAKETPGTVVGFHRSGKSNLVSVFEYEVYGQKYRTSSISTWFKDCLGSKWCLGERYMIRYSWIEPQNAKVLWDKHLTRSDTLDTE
jgi:hypothetical protein